MQNNDAIEIALSFTGKRNSDWTPIIRTFKAKGIQFEMCLVPPGSFEMGSNDHNDEKPIHTQTLTQPYWIGVHPITNAQWQIAVNHSNGTVEVPTWADWYKDNSKSNHPVVGVTWYQCIEFLKWLGADWGLPTEPQWEYAARGLENLVYPFGNDFKPDWVIYSENSKNSTAAIRRRPQGASWVGAQDLSGNVWEWMANDYKAYPYKADDESQNTSSNLSRGLRGSSWYLNHNTLMRSACRDFTHLPLGTAVSVFVVCVPLLYK